MPQKSLIVLIAGLACAGAGAQLFPEERDALDTLLSQVERSLTTQSPPLWSLFSPLGSLAVMADEDGGWTTARRNELRHNASTAAAFTLPRGARATFRIYESARELMTGQAIFESSEKRHWLATFATLPDGPGGACRLTALSIFPSDRLSPPQISQDAVNVVKAWERVLREGQMLELRPHLYPEPFLAILGKGSMELFLYVDPERYITMARYAVEVGRPEISEMSELHACSNGAIATVTGTWKAPNVVFGLGDYRLTAMLLKTDEGWKVAGLFMGTQTQY